MARLDHEVTQDGGATAVRLSGDLDMDGVLRLEPALTDLVERRAVPALTLDLRGVTFIDSTGLGLIVQTHEAARRSGCALEILAAADSVQRVFRVAGLEDVLPFAHGSGDLLERPQRQEAADAADRERGDGG